MQVNREVARVFRPLLNPSRYKFAKGGRGSGKSYFFAECCVFALLEGKRVLGVREVQRSIADSVKRLIEDRIADLGLEAYFDVTRDEIRCPASGGLMIFRGMQNHTAASVKSLEGFDIAWWEEAQTAGQRSLELLVPTIRKKGSELWFSWNPEEETDPIEGLVSNAGNEAIIVHANWQDNPWFSTELRDELERDKVRDPDKYAHVWEGAFRSHSEARVFRNWRKGELDPPDDVVWLYGADWGFSQDATAAVRCCIPEGDTLYVDAEVYGIGIPTDALPGFLADLPDATKWPMRGDSARPETIDYCKRHGFPKLRAAKKGKGSVEDGVSFLQGMDIVVHPRCANLVRELGAYAYKTDPRTGEILPVIEDKNNHAIDALRYAVEGLHRRGKRVKETRKQAERRRGVDYGGFDDADEEVSWKVA